MRKPNKLRVRGTDFALTMFDMASDGSQFYASDSAQKKRPSRDRTRSRKNPPTPFSTFGRNFSSNAIAVRGLDPGNEYMVAGDSETIEDAARKHLYIEQEYTLSVMQPKAGPVKIPLRVITFHRDDMLPYDQDIYDSDGNLEEQIRYGTYVQFGTVKYPSKITIKLPQEGIQLVLTVDDVQENVPVTDDQFQVKIPEGTTIKQLK